MSRNQPVQTMKKNSDISLNLQQVLILLVTILLVSCGGSSSGNLVNTDSPVNEAPNQPGPEPQPDVVLAEIDIQLQSIIEEQGLTGAPELGRDLPSIEEPIAQLGKKLFFSKSLGGDMDTACVSCHHPLLGGADGLSLAVGVGANDPDLLGPGRADLDGLPDVPRNSPSVFNLGLVDVGLFWDSRVESLDATVLANGAGGGIRTPESAFNTADPNAASNLPATQARFPVLSDREMKGNSFEDGALPDAIRAHLAARIGDYGIGAGELTTNSWITEFQTAFDSTQDATQLITFDAIAFAIGEYQRSMLFVNNPWFNYIQGDIDALTNQQKNGAVLFYTSVDEGGAGCFNCHSGDRFSDDLFHVVAFPQIGPGRGHGTTGDGDFGRGAVSGAVEDNFAFRTPSLLNIETSPPYGHAGVYPDLDEVINHYDNSGQNVNSFFNNEEWCDLQQFENIPNCEDLFVNAETNSDDAVDALQDERRAGTSLFENFNLNNQEENQLEDFLEALTDPCVLDRECLAPWIADETSSGPDGNQLNAQFSD